MNSATFGSRRGEGAQSAQARSAPAALPALKLLLFHFLLVGAVSGSLLSLLSQTGCLRLWEPGVFCCCFWCRIIKSSFHFCFFSFFFSVLAGAVPLAGAAWRLWPGKGRGAGVGEGRGPPPGSPRLARRPARLGELLLDRSRPCCPASRSLSPRSPPNDHLTDSLWIAAPRGGR